MVVVESATSVVVVAESDATVVTAATGVFDDVEEHDVTPAEHATIKTAPTRRDMAFILTERGTDLADEGVGFVPAFDQRQPVRRRRRPR